MTFELLFEITTLGGIGLGLLSVAASDAANAIRPEPQNHIRVEPREATTPVSGKAPLLKQAAASNELPKAA